MAYYQGDYYQGDYYQGDPFLGGLIASGVSWLGKKLFKRKLTTIGQTALAARVTTGLRRTAGPAIVGAGLAAASGIRIPIPFTPFRVQPGAFLPGGTPLVSRRSPVLDQAMMTGMGGPGCCPSGYHPSKDGSGRCVKNRSMNVANPRALRRSLRRVAGFGKLAQRSKKDIRRAAKAIGA